MSISSNACLQATPEGTLLLVRVSPNASRNAFGGMMGHEIKLFIQAPPVDGKANRAVCAFLATQFSLSRQSVVLAGGETSRSKRVLLKGLSLPEAQSIVDERMA